MRGTAAQISSFTSEAASIHAELHGGDPRDFFGPAFDTLLNLQRNGRFRVLGANLQAGTHERVVSAIVAGLANDNEVLADFDLFDRSPSDPYSEANHRAIKLGINKALLTLQPREERVIRLMYGLTPDGVEHTLDEVAELLMITRERVRQIEAKAIRKMKHPSRSRFFGSYDCLIS